MSKYLPYRGFCWTDPNAYDEDFIKNYDKGKYGALLEADVEYPVNVKIKHKDLAFLPEKRKINNTNKLITTLEDKNNYIVHVAALKQALSQGLKLTKIHRVIEFKQKLWMKKYIDENIKLRKDAKNEAEKNFFKLTNNAVFGKAMENIRNNRDIKLVNTYEQMIKLVSRPNLHSSTCFSENLMAIEMKKTGVYMNKPTYIGQAILDISKTLMYEFFYDYLKPKYGDKIKICYMDTDSFILHIQTEDFYKDISHDVNEWFDTSEISKKANRPITPRINKKELGMMKFELGDDEMIECTNARAKLYAYLYQKRNNEIHESKRAKGTKKCITKKELTYQDFKDSVENGTIKRKIQYRFKSDHHNIFTEKIKKISIISNDDKRIQAFDKSIRYQYGTNSFQICLSELIFKKSNKLLIS